MARTSDACFPSKGCDGQNKDRCDQGNLHNAAKQAGGRKTTRAWKALNLDECRDACDKTVNTYWHNIYIKVSFWEARGLKYW